MPYASAFVMHIKKTLLLFLFCLLAVTAYSQQATIHGHVFDPENDVPVIGANVVLMGKDTVLAVTDTNGYFIFPHILSGSYIIRCRHIGYYIYQTGISIADTTSAIGTIKLFMSDNILQEVKVVEHAMAVTQKNDTTEYDAGAFKTNPDATGTDLIRKMPGMQLFGKQLKAQGEDVVQILVDGQPFFGTDPYATLSNLSADMVAKVQVYNEKTAQEQFTGIHTMPTAKTVNIITKANKRHSTFGKAYAGYGDEQKYIAGADVNVFDGSRRITITGQSNNINIQNFTPETIVNATTNSSIATTTSGGFNYSDQLGKKLTFSTSFIYSNAKNNTQGSLHRQYISPVDSGQNYEEHNTASGITNDYRLNMRINYNIDSFNSILFQPQLSFQKNNSNTITDESTALGGNMLSLAHNYTPTALKGHIFTGSVLYNHSFKKTGRKFSLNIDIDQNGNNGNNKLIAQNIFYNSPSLSDTLNQFTDIRTSNVRISSNAVYVEPVTKNGTLNVMYNVAYQPANSIKNTYNATNDRPGYLSLDTALSNTFTTNGLIQKEAIGYNMHNDRFDYSLSLAYQQSALVNQEQTPVTFSINKQYNALLPALSFQYHISRSKSFNILYNVNTSLPSIEQLQNVVNNINPLLLTVGNTSLNQSYLHTITMRYNSGVKTGNLFVMLNANISKNFITSNSIIAARDTVVQSNIILPQGAQLTIPVNVNGYWSLRTYTGYSLLVNAIKSNLSFNVNFSIDQLPGMINSQINYTRNKNAGININLSSNISEYIDFTLVSSISYNTAKSTINTNIVNKYINETSGINFNWIFWKGLFINTELDHQYNNGLATGFNQNYLLWNISAGKKIFRHHQGEVRLLVYDLLNQNNNIRHTVSETFIEDAQSNTLHRYFMALFTYHFKSNPH